MQVERKLFKSTQAVHSLKPSSCAAKLNKNQWCNWGGGEVGKLPTLGKFEGNFEGRGMMRKKGREREKEEERKKRGKEKGKWRGKEGKL